jgi:tRNA(Arg) A34 adenosine deaminase TadA
MSQWRSLQTPWQVAFEEALKAYLHENSAPIGAVVVDDTGAVVSRGRNDFHAHRLAHAEMNALSAVPGSCDRSRLEIYSTLEPCPMCTGAIRMFQLRAVRFAANDPSAGSTRFLQANEFMREFPCEVHGPHNKVLEAVVVALIMEYRERNNHHRWREQWRTSQPRAVQLGNDLAASGAHAVWRRSTISAEELFDQVASQLVA